VLFSLASQVFLTAPEKNYLFVRPNAYFWNPGLYPFYSRLDVQRLPLGEMDRASMETYHETLVAKEMLVYNSLYIEEIVKRNLGNFFIFPCDGAGTGARICQAYNQLYRSGDLCPRGKDVEFEAFATTIEKSPREGLIVLSFAMSFLSQKDLEVLRGRNVICVDRHKCDHWNVLTSDNITTGNLLMEVDGSETRMVALRDNNTRVPPPYLPLFLNNKRNIYDSKLSRDDLISLLRFLSLHKWSARLVVDEQHRDLLISYGFTRTTGNRFADTIANDPFHAIDFFNGVNYLDRLAVHGIPRECNLNHVLQLDHEPKPPTGSVERAGKYYLRFREAGQYAFHCNGRAYSIEVKPKVKVNWGKKRVEPLVELRTAFGRCDVKPGIDICDIESPLTPNEVLFYRSTLDLAE